MAWLVILPLSFLHIHVVVVLRSICRIVRGNKTFDVIVVGSAVSGGAVVPARLSANPNRRVLLLEAGPDFAPKSYACVGAVGLL